MSDELIKRSDENENQYLWRIDNLIRSGTYKNWEEVTPIVNQQLYDDEMDYKGESAFRKKVAAARQFYEAGVFDTFSEDEYLKKLQKQKEEIELEKIKLRDERTVWGREQRTVARLDNCVEMLGDLIKNTTPYQYIPNSIHYSGYNDLLVCLSDIHMGLETEGFYGSYDPEVAERYMIHYLSEIRDVAARYEINECYLAILGDLINGKIHLTTMIENRDDVIIQVQQVAELVTWFISELCKTFKHVYVNSVGGNHSRLDKKDAVIRTERLDNLVSWYAKARLHEYPNLTFTESRYDPTIAYFNIRGLQFILCHGDYDTKSENGVQKITMMIGEVPYAIVMGHHHTTAYEEISGVKVIQSGSFAGSGSDYCITKRIIGEPSQAVAVVSDRGIEAFYPVILYK